MIEIKEIVTDFELKKLFKVIINELLKFELYNVTKYRTDCKPYNSILHDHTHLYNYNTHSQL